MSAALNKHYLYPCIHTYLIALIDEQVQPDCDYLENRKAPEMFLNCNNGQEYFVEKIFRSVVYSRLGGSDCQGFDNKVPSPFHKMGRVRLLLQQKKKISCILVNPQESFFVLFKELWGVDDFTN